MTVYIVHSHSSRQFESLADARAFAESYFQRTGNAVAITQEPPRRKSLKPASSEQS